MRLSLLLATTLWGCGFSASGAPAPDGGTSAPDRCASVSKFYDSCQLTFAGDLVLASGAYTYDTDHDKLTDATGAEVAVGHVGFATPGDPVDAIYAAHVHLMTGATLRAIGGKGFAILAHDLIVLDGNAAIDVSAGGAGARATCGSAAPDPGANDSGGAGGGGGGGFGAAGGRGGNGNKDHGVFGSDSMGGKGGAAAVIPGGPRGGCPGAAGGQGDDHGGAGGLGGGAVYLVAGDRITLAAGAVINAGGAGGGGGGGGGANGDAGGGGGGAGGMLWLEAPHVLAPAGSLVANGGGGGEGSGNGVAGAAGNPGTLTAARATGGSGGGSSGTGGALGGSQDTAAGDSVMGDDDGGGGGGGGSVGFIHIDSSDFQHGTVSPSAQ